MYGITLRGSTYNSHREKIKIMQKRIVRSIYGAEYVAHTHILFTELGLLKLEDIYKYETSKFMYCYLDEITPLPLQLNLKHASSVDNYATRQAKTTRLLRHWLKSTPSSVLVKGMEVRNTPLYITIFTTLTNWLLSLYDA